MQWMKYNPNHTILEVQKCQTCTSTKVTRLSREHPWREDQPLEFLGTVTDLMGRQMVYVASERDSILTNDDPPHMEKYCLVPNQRGYTPPTIVVYDTP